MTDSIYDVELPSSNPIILSTTEDSIECPICMEDNVNIAIMPCCMNILCSECFKEWHGKNNQPSCSFCRHSDVYYIHICNPIHNDYILNITDDTLDTTIDNSNRTERENILHRLRLHYDRSIVIILLCTIYSPFVVVAVLYFVKDIK